MSTRGLVVAISLLMFVDSGTRGQAQRQIDVLSLPLTPGSIALLVNEPDSDARQARLTEALSAPRADVRSVAARVVTVRRAVRQRDAVGTALARETDPAAAANLVRAMFTLGRAADSIVQEAIDRIGGASAIALAELVVRTKGLAVLDHLPTLLAKSADPVALARVVSVLAVQDASSRTRLAGAIVATGSVEMWDAYDSAIAVHRLELGEDEWVPALRAVSPEIRRSALWSVLQSLRDERKASEAVMTAALPRAADPPATLETEALLRELVARASGQKRPVNLAPAVLAAGDDFRPFAAIWLTRPERETIERQGGERLVRQERAAPRPPEGRPTDMPTRTVWPISPGLTAEVMQLAGCKSSRGSQYGAAVVEYAEDGSPKQVRLFGRPGDSRCDRAIGALSSLTVARADQLLSVQPREILLHPLERKAVSCLDSFDQSVPVLRVGGAVKSPSVLREVQPSYTPGAMSRKAQGWVLADVIVSERGCAAYASVKRGLDPDLDLQALHAILQWTFEPARADGIPIPVWVTIEVSFRLK